MKIKNKLAKIEEKDTHGGFHGDGEALAKAYSSDKQAQEFISEIKYKKIAYIYLTHTMLSVL